MNQSKLKTYAQQARRDFIAAVSDRAALHGLTRTGSDPVVVRGDTVLIGDRAFPHDVAEKRRLLDERVRRDGFEQTMEAIAYTWFNRFAAIRYMELHGYLNHGYRVLSHPEGGAQPEILEHAADIDLPDLNREKAVDLKLDGRKDEELYRLLLLAQCNALHRAMPFLFKPVGDETELLLPANLLHTDSLIRRLVDDVDETDWNEIEIVGWLYQFYISEKKDEVIGKIVKPEDIPAATQLFTPNWIVKYMVQNSLGAQWLALYPNSVLKGQMAYYIEPAEQTDEVNTQLEAITPESLNPEELTLIDPACGSGHILIEAYHLFKAIYLERGYRQRDVPKLILEKNLFGLDIDERAAQLTGFALMMTGRADDRRLFERGVKLNVMALVNSTGFDAAGLAEWVKLADYGLRAGDLTELKRLFEHATTFGSLIQVPGEVAAKLPALRQSRLENQNLASQQPGQDELFPFDPLKQLGTLTQQAEFLAAQYDAVVTNPPYMGGKGMHALVKKFAKDHFPDAKADLFSCFIERGYTLAKCAGHIALVTMQSWMFLSSFEKMRERLLREKTITTMAHLGARAFGSISGEIVQTTAFALHNRSSHGYRPVFFRLLEGGEEEKRTVLRRGQMRFETTHQHEFKKIPGSPVAYWVYSEIAEAFRAQPPLSSMLSLKAGMSTGNNDVFQRYWHEVDLSRIAFDYPSSPAKWVPCNSGGGFRKWFGNNLTVVNWEDKGAAMRCYRNAQGKIASAIRNEDWYFRPGLTWTKISSGRFAARWMPEGFSFDDTGRSGFVVGAPGYRESILAAMVSNFAHVALNVLAPTMSVTSGELSKVPIPSVQDDNYLRSLATTAIEISRWDWNLYERSWEFARPPLLSVIKGSLRDTLHAIESTAEEKIAELLHIELLTNDRINRSAGLESITPDVPIEQITLTINPAYRYGGKLTEEERWTQFRQDTMQELVSYAIGCMMGRYSLDEPGLIYAQSGNEGFNSSCYTTFPADQDGIIPITDGQWFDDDAAHRLIEFISKAWDAGHLEDNLSFLADNLSPRKNEPSRNTIRRYLSDSFFKDHLQTYKNRPIYWLFSSGKAKAFQCLVYLHRYNEGTLARMRTEYVVPLQGMMASRVRRLDGDIAAAASTAHRRRLEKERSTLVRQQAELQKFDEKLRSYADKRISLDLDDGVKVNYGKFSDLLAEVKKVTGAKAD